MSATITREAEAFLREARVAVIATVDAQGHPRTAPIWFLWDDDAAHLFTGRGTRKWREIEANPRVSLSVDERDPERYEAVIIDGRVEEVTDRSLYDDVRTMALAYYGPERGETFAEGYRGDRADVAHFRIVPERVTHQRS
ncbi:MAG: pyridoxamine 5'-phosphate oxidase family protein [Dehalococcoidia bacterium]|nr:pyridoxamine 5'-phosphate oxidase family protein [Dehalococcoidia bacterium]